jgi:hypothetical protein
MSEENPVAMKSVGQVEFYRYLGGWDLVTSLNINLPIGNRGSTSHYKQKTYYTVLECIGVQVIPDISNPIGVVTYEPGSRPIKYSINLNARSDRPAKAHI